MGYAVFAVVMETRDIKVASHEAAPLSVNWVYKQQS
jgi:hypothetical protein